MGLFFFQTAHYSFSFFPHPLPNKEKMPKKVSLSPRSVRALVDEYYETPWQRNDEDSKLVFRFVSDLHLDMWDSANGEPFPPPPDFSKKKGSDCDVMVIGGDLHEAEDAEKFCDALRRVTVGYDHVIFVPGNHEYYSPKQHYGMSKIDNIIRQCCRHVGGDTIHTLNPGVISIGGVRFVGATLWTPVPSQFRQWASTAMNDYTQIWSNAYKYSNVTPGEIDQVHSQHRKFFADNVTSVPENRIVAVSHHIPTFRLYDGTGQVRFGPDLAPLYHCNDMDGIISAAGDKLRCWCCGHDHKSTAVRMVDVGFSRTNNNEDNSLFIRNALGYPTDWRKLVGFDPRMQVSV